MPDLPTLEDRSARALDALLTRREREIAAVLREALEDIRSQMARIYEKYEIDGVLTRAEMTKYNRLTAMEKQITEAVSPAIRQTVNQVRRLSPEMYNAAFFRYAWAIDNASGLRITWGALNMKAIAADLDNPYRRIALDNYRLTTPIQFKRAINSGLLQGKSYAQMMRDIRKAVSLKAYEAMRIARTEGQAAINAGTDFAYNTAIDKGVAMQVIWDATLDGSTRPDHGAADGQVRGEDGNFRVGGEKTPYPSWEGMSAGNRINCRCHLRSQIEGYAPALRRTRDRGVQPYQTYEQWRRGR